MTNKTLPVEIWERIASKLTLRDRFQFGSCSKNLYEITRHIPYHNFFDLYTHKRNCDVGSFFWASVSKSKVKGDNVDYDMLKLYLNKFYYVRSVDLSEVSATLHVAKKIFKCLPNKSYHGPLNVSVNHGAVSLWKTVAADADMERQILINKQQGMCKRKETDLLEESRLSKKRCTPSPILKHLEPFENHLAEFKTKLKSRFTDGEITQTKLPTSLSHLLHNNVDYVKDHKVFTKPAEDMSENILTKQLADNVINAVAPYLIEGLITTIDGHWIYVTQLEAYVRNSLEIDDCAQTTLIQSYPATPLVKLERKTEHGSEWLEIKVFWKKFEFLVTGGLFGSYLHDDISCFLGPSFPAHFNVDLQLSLYMPCQAFKVIKETRLLRNFCKKAANFQWCFKSLTFVNKGFCTASLTSIIGMGMTDCCTVACIIAKCKTYGTFRSEDKQQIVSMMSELGLLTSTDLAEKSKKGSAMKLSTTKKLLIQITLALQQNNFIKDADYVSLYKQIIAPKLKSLNNKTIKNNIHLL